MKCEDLKFFDMELIIPWIVLFNKDASNPYVWIYDHEIWNDSLGCGHDLKSKVTPRIQNDVVEYYDI